MAFPEPESPPVTSTGWSLLSWPLILVILDGYEPQLAPHIIAAIADLDDQSCAVTIRLMTIDAEGGMNLN